MLLTMWNSRRSSWINKGSAGTVLCDRWRRQSRRCRPREVVEYNRGEVIRKGCWSASYLYIPNLSLGVVWNIWCLERCVKIWIIAGHTWPAIFEWRKPSGKVELLIISTGFALRPCHRSAHRGSTRFLLSRCKDTTSFWNFQTLWGYFYHNRNSPFSEVRW